MANILCCKCEIYCESFSLLVCSSYVKLGIMNLTTRYRLLLLFSVLAGWESLAMAQRLPPGVTTTNYFPMTRQSPRGRGAIP